MVDSKPRWKQVPCPKGCGKKLSEAGPGRSIHMKYCDGRPWQEQELDKKRHHRELQKIRDKERQQERKETGTVAPKQKNVAVRRQLQARVDAVTIIQATFPKGIQTTNPEQLMEDLEWIEQLMKRLLGS